MELRHFYEEKNRFTKAVLKIWYLNIFLTDLGNQIASLS